MYRKEHKTGNIAGDRWSPVFLMQKDGKRQPEDFSDKMRATGGRPYKIHVIFNTFASTAATANVLLWSETPFVCLMYFRRRENTFAFISARQLLLNFCTRDKRGVMEKPRQTVRQPLPNLCTRDKREEMQNPRKRDSSAYLVRQRPFSGVKRPSLLKKRQPTLLYLLFVQQNRLPITPLLGAWSALLTLVSLGHDGE